MRAVVGLLTLAFMGIIVADLVMHPEALKAGGNALNNVLVPVIGGMLGAAPGYNAQK